MTAEIPVPSLASGSRARILERFVLKPFGRKSGDSTIREQQIAVGGDEVRHLAPLPDMPMEPEATIHGVDHSLASRSEFAKGAVGLRRRNKRLLLFAGCHA